MGVSSREYEVDSSKIVQVGGQEGQKNLVHIRNPETSVSGTFFSKETYLNSKEIIKKIKVNTQLKKDGFNVPDTMRWYEHDGKQHILMSDMTEGGKYEVWGINGHSPDPQEKITLESWKLNSEQVQQISDNVLDIAQKAKNRNYIFSFDMYHLRREKSTGKVDIILLDPRRDATNRDNEEVNGYYNQGQAFNFIEKFLQVSRKMPIDILKK